jgi:hypothetical protein
MDVILVSGHIVTSFVTRILIVRVLLYLLDKYYFKQKIEYAELYFYNPIMLFRYIVL